MSILNGTGGGSFEVDDDPLWTFNALLLFNKSDLFSWFCSFLAEASEAELRIFLTAVPDRTLSNAVWLKLALILGVKIINKEVGSDASFTGSTMSKCTK